jgi:hypothetical protein
LAGGGGGSARRRKLSGDVKNRWGKSSSGDTGGCPGTSRLREGRLAGGSGDVKCSSEGRQGRLWMLRGERGGGAENRNRISAFICQTFSTL